MKATVEKRERNRVSLHIEIEEPRVERCRHRRLAQRFSVLIPARAPLARFWNGALAQKRWSRAVDLLWPDVFKRLSQRQALSRLVAMDLAENIGHEALRL